MQVKTFFRKLFVKRGEETTARALSIEGVPSAPVTPEPDDAELAAQAVLEMMAGKKANVANGSNKNKYANEEHNAAFYRHVADRIREARSLSALRAMRFVAYVEQQLRNPRLPFHGQGSLAMLEVELYKRIDIIEREGGELKRRWQHCLAEVTVRMMDDG